MLRRPRAPEGPGGGPHHPQNQGGSDAISTCRPSASEVCRPATATAKRAVCSARWRAAAGC
jgi:hypothetical protein